MARLVATATGNFTASIWGLCDAASVLDSEASSQSLTTSAVTGSSFVPAAVAITAILLKVQSRAASGSTPTLTVTLRNVTTVTDIASVTIGVQDVPESVSNSDPGWIQFKLASTHTPNGTDSYAIKVVVSGATPNLALYRDATTNNFSRLLRTTTVQAPAAGDLFVIAKELTGVGTDNGGYTITMDSTATTQYGTTSGLSTSTLVNSAVAICNGCTVTWGTTAATNYVWRMAGCLAIFRGGTMTMGTSGTPMPRDSSASLEFVTTASGDSGLWVANFATFRAFGQSRTSGKDKWWTLLTTDKAAAATSLDVADDTGWLNGDLIAIAATTQTYTQAEQRNLNANAGASTLAFTSGLTNAHLGNPTNEMQAEVILLTRNVKIKTSHANAALPTFTYSQQSAIFDIEWVEIFNVGASSTNRQGVTTEAGVNGTCSINKCSIYGDSTSGYAWFWPSSAGAGYFTVTNNVVYRLGGSGGFTFGGTTAYTGYSLSGNILVRSGSFGFNLFDVGGTINNNRASGGANSGFQLSDSSGVYGSFSGNISHSNSGNGFNFNPFTLPDNISFPAVIAWRNGTTGISVQASTTVYISWNRVVWDGVKAWGNATQNVWIKNWMVDCVFKNWVVAGDTAFGTGNGVIFDSGLFCSIRFENCIFGGGGGTKTTHSSIDFSINVASVLQIIFSDCQLLSATEFTAGASIKYGSFIKLAHKDNTAGVHESHFPPCGRIALDTSVFNTAAPSERLTPLSTTMDLYSAPVRVAVDSGQTVTFSVYVRKDGSYNGTIQPRLVLRSNPALGIDAEVILDTLSVGANTWEQLTGTSVAVGEDGVLEAVVEINGTAGNAYVDDWAVS